MENRKTLELGTRTLIMGILNVTPDSFSDGGVYSTPERAIRRAEELVNQGADIIDIGGETSKPGSIPISADEELKRVLPVVRHIHARYPHIFLSIDTYKSAVAEQVLEEGVDMINSLGGFHFDSELAHVVSAYTCYIAIYHIKGTPEIMQKGEIAYDDVMASISTFFASQTRIGETAGVKKEQFILDPGIGFGKTTDQNLEILKRLEELQSFHMPILIGVSRKSHIGAILKEELGLAEAPPPLKRLEGALAETAVAIRNGASIVRTHDVAETRRFIAVLDQFR